MEFEITVFTKANGPLTKTIALSDGKPVSDSAACRMANGTARRVRFSGEAYAVMQALADLINNLNPNEAYALGRLKDGVLDHVRVVRADKLNGATDTSAIARTKEYLIFEEGKPGLALLDGDFKGMPEGAARRLKECGGLWGALCEVLPALETVAFVERAPTSSNLRNGKTGQTFPGSGGRHIVIPVLDAADFPRFLSDLDDRLWLAGWGWGMVSAAGSFLERSLIDKSVGSSERLIFEGGPIVKLPLVQEGRHAVAYDGLVLDTRLLLPLTDDEKAELKEIKDAEELRLLPERQEARTRWSVKHIERLTAAGMSEGEACARIDRWIDHHELSGDFPLPFDEPEIAGTTVAQVLAAPDKYIDKTLSDPLEGPSYGLGKAILYRRPDGSLWIKSFAHGGARYDFKPDFAAVLAKAEALKTGDIVALRALINESLASLEKLQREPLIKAAAKAIGIPVDDVRALVRETEAERVRKAQSSRQALEAARVAREQERQRLWQSCKDIALSPTLLADMEKIVHNKLGVIGEGAPIRGAFLAATSRMLKRVAISYLRRGAAAAGKNHLILAVLRLFPEESVIQISSATPMALIYMGEGEDDINALKGKVIVMAMKSCAHPEPANRRHVRSG
jgi:hypothetical protein